MSTPEHTTSTDVTGRTDCERCDADRPSNPQRFTITVSDFTDATADVEKLFLCRRCWEQERDRVRREFA